LEGEEVIARIRVWIIVRIRAWIRCEMVVKGRSWWVGKRVRI